MLIQVSACLNQVVEFFLKDDLFLSSPKLSSESGYVILKADAI